MREQRLSSGPLRFNPRREMMPEPEAVSAILRLSELGWGNKRISRERGQEPGCSSATTHPRIAWTATRPGFSALRIMVSS